LRCISATLLLGVWGMAGCAPVRRYHPVPISPAATAASLQARSVLAPPVRQFIQENVGHDVNPWPPRAWNLRMLTLAAFYFSPVLAEARAEISAAQAGIVTAGARPNPTFSLQPGMPSPYLFALSFLVPIETAGKRRIRVEQAKDIAREARLTLAEAAWQVRSGVRKELVRYFLATRQLRLLRLQQRLEVLHAALLEQRLAAGEISRPRVDNARLLLLNARVAVEAAEGRVPEARAALAAAVGVPVAGLGGIKLAWPGFDDPPGTKLISRQLIQSDAVLNRLDVRGALAAYAASEAALQLEIAKQYPNFHIGPGYQFEETHNYFTLGYSVTLPIFNRNQGPIAEAEARRKEAAEAFLATQARAIADGEESLARYRASMRVLDGTEKALGQLERVVIPKERRVVAIGQADRLALNAVLLERPALGQAWLAALGRAQSALGALEDAVERPLESGDISAAAPQSPELKSSHPREDANR